MAADLSPDDRDGLLRLARSRQTPHGIAARARLVLDCADVGLAEAARRSSVSRATAAKWSARFVERGVDGLRDGARTGRPATADDVVERVLSCALDEPPDGTSHWTTRAVAEAVGVSQATASRVRRRYFPRPEGSAALLDASTSILVYLDVQPTGCALGFHASGASPRGGGASADRLDVAETIVCSTLLGNPLLRSDWNAAQQDSSTTIRRALERLPAKPAASLILDMALNPAATQLLSRRPEISVRSVTPGEWLTLVHRVAEIIDPRQLSELRDLQRQIRLARRDGATRFTWSRAAAASRPAPAPAVQAETEPPAGDLTFVVRGICDEVLDGQLHFGEPISARRVSRRAGVSPGRVAEALNQLADEALIDKHGGHFLLPVPTPRDVIETYTARGLLGTAITRRLASAQTELPPVIDVHLAGIVRCNSLGLALECGEIDLDLQDELARASQMPRIGSMFIRLSLQLRLFLTIFGLNYRYPTDEILADDRHILAEIRRHDPDAAVEAWRSKIDNAARYMLTRLSVLRA